MRWPAEEIHLWLGVPGAEAVLRRYTDAKIVVGEHGKPRLAAAGLHFNLSHSGEHRVLAVARREVGVDVEVVRDRGDVRELAAIGLPPEQAARWRPRGPRSGTPCSTASGSATRRAASATASGSSRRCRRPRATTW